jgi:hypothetical protein
VSLLWELHSVGHQQRITTYNSVVSFFAWYRCENSAVAPARLHYVNEVWANRDAAARGDDYFLEVWTDESYVHHHHHAEYGWVGELPEDLFPAFQFKGTRCCDIVRVITVVVVSHLRAAPRMINGLLHAYVVLLAGKRFIMIDAFWTVPCEKVKLNDVAQAGFVEGAQKIWRPDVVVRRAAVELLSVECCSWIFACSAPSHPCCLWVCFFADFAHPSHRSATRRKQPLPRATELSTPSRPTITRTSTERCTLFVIALNCFQPFSAQVC